MKDALLRLLAYLLGLVDETKAEQAPEQPVQPAPAPVVVTGGHFEAAYAFTIPNEGGYVNHPNDNGGPTNRGITLATLAAYRKRPTTAEDVRNLGVEETKQIYRKNYWNSHFDELPRAIAICLFDWGGLHGPASAQKMAQRCANELGANLVIDGVIGPASVAAINAIDPKLFQARYVLSIRQWLVSFTQRDARQLVFLRGWMNRCDRLAKAT